MSIQKHMFPAHFVLQYNTNPKTHVDSKKTCQVSQVSRHFFASLSVRLVMPEERRARLDTNLTVCLLVQMNASKLGIDMFFLTCIIFQNKILWKSSQLASLPWLSDLCSWPRVRETATCASTACLHVCWDRNWIWCVAVCCSAMQHRIISHSCVPQRKTHTHTFIDTHTHP